MEETAFLTPKSTMRCSATEGNKFPLINHLLIFLFLIAALGNLYCGRKTERKSVLISADVNRDGLVDFDSDLAEKSLWTFERGALFFNNNDSDTNSGSPDYADSAVNGREDLEDLSLLRIRRNKKTSPRNGCQPFCG